MSGQTSPVPGDDLRTRDLVARSILENGPSTAAALGQRLSLTPAGIRRHLDLLVADGVLQAREPHSAINRGRGRPSKVFVMSDKGREQFEHSYDDLAVAALKFMSAQSGEHLVSNFAQSRADDIERKATVALAKKSNKTEALAQFLTEQGYAASIEKKPMGEELCQHHCPIAHVAACFSVERTKYLIVSKKIPERSEPQFGIGFFSNSARPFKRRSSIHCGSDFFAEISRTTSSLSPRLAFVPTSLLSDQPYS